METQSEMIEVRELEREGRSVLVEFDGLRRYVPVGKVKDGMVEKELFDRGVPFGLPFDKMINVQIDSLALAQSLRDMGIWTKDDFMKQFGRVQKLFHRAVDAELKKLIQEVEKNG